MSNYFKCAHPGTIPVAALDSIQKSPHFTVLAVRTSTHNRAGIRLADTFLLALVILPEVLLWEMVGIAMGRPHMLGTTHFPPLLHLQDFTQSIMDSGFLHVAGQAESHFLLAICRTCHKC